MYRRRGRRRGRWRRRSRRRRRGIWRRRSRRRRRKEEEKVDSLHRVFFELYLELIAYPYLFIWYITFSLPERSFHVGYL